MTQTTYALDNRQRGAGTSLSWLAQAHDPTTKAIVGPLIPADGRILELGAGTGSIARWMADQAGAGGLVVAADLNTQLMTTTAHPGVRVVQHDLLTGLPRRGVEDPDLIHARCLFAHLQNREELTEDCFLALRPGGYLVIEDMGGDTSRSEVLTSPYPDTADLLEIYTTSLIRMFQAAGNDTSWARTTNEAMAENGFQGVTTYISSRSWRGNQAGCQLVIALSEQVENQLVANGATHAQLARLRDQLSDPDVVIIGNSLWSTVGQKPLED